MAMIDAHCHLEQHDYDKDRDAVVQRAKDAGLKAVVTCCAKPSDLDLTLKMVEKYKGFVFAIAGMHPEYIKDSSQEEIEDFLKRIKSSKQLVGIGEAGLDFFWVKEERWKKKQEEFFVSLIQLAKSMKKPIVIHSREAEELCIKMLEQEDATDVLMHMFGANNLTKRVIDNGWNISVNAILLRSKKHGKVIRDCPLESLMLETDAPWLDPRTIGSAEKARNEPTTIRVVAEKVAEIKNLQFEAVWKACGANTTCFFRLPFK